MSVNDAPGRRDLAPVPTLETQLQIVCDHVLGGTKMIRQEEQGSQDLALVARWPDDSVFCRLHLRSFNVGLAIGTVIGMLVMWGLVAFLGAP
jgi:hypothetical protein